MTVERASWNDSRRGVLAMKDKMNPCNYRGIGLLTMTDKSAPGKVIGKGLCEMKLEEIFSMT